MIELKGEVSKSQSFEGRLGGFTFAERAEVLAELDKLLAETDPLWVIRLNGWSIAAKIRFLQLCRGTMLNSIENKGVTIPNTQPFRTIHTLIDQIVGDAEGLWTTNVKFSKNGNIITATETLEDGSTVQHTITLDESGNPVSVVTAGRNNEVSISYDANGNAEGMTVNGENFPMEWEGF